MGEDISPELKESTSKQVQTENAILNSDFQKQMKNGLYATFEHNDHKVPYGHYAQKSHKARSSFAFENLNSK